MSFDSSISCGGRFAVTVSPSSSIESRMRPISIPERTRSRPVVASREVMSAEIIDVHNASMSTGLKGIWRIASATRCRSTPTPVPAHYGRRRTFSA